MDEIKCKNCEFICRAKTRRKGIKAVRCAINGYALICYEEKKGNWSKNTTPQWCPIKIDKSSDIKRWLDKNAPSRTKGEIVRFMENSKIQDAEEIYTKWRKNFMKIKII